MQLFLWPSDDWPDLPVAPPPDLIDNLDLCGLKTLVENPRIFALGQKSNQVGHLNERGKEAWLAQTKDLGLKQLRMAQRVRITDHHNALQLTTLQLG